MEEPEKENIKLPFLQRCRIQLFNQICANGEHDSLKSNTMVFIH